MSISERIVEISGDNRYLHLKRGFLAIKQDEEELATVPLDSILAVIITGYSISYSNDLLVRLAQEGIPLFTLDKSFHPIGAYISLQNKSRQAERIEIQLSASKPFKKNLWRDIIQEKIRNQQSLLKILNQEYQDFDNFIKKIRSGDADNFEAQAARLYWQRLNIIRRQDADDINGFFNYGYAIIRAAIARYLVASGFIPSIGVFHCNKLNNFCLVDDLIEPFRPYIDRVAISLYKENDKLTPKVKQKFVGCLRHQVEFKEEETTLNNAISKYIYSVIQAYSGNGNVIFPKLIFL